MAQSSYLGRMRLIKTEQQDNRSPRDHLGAIAEFWNYIKQDRPHRWASMGLAITIPLLVTYGVYRSLIQPEPGPTIIYVESWPADRSQADVERDWKARAVEINENNAKRRAAYRSVADTLGIDYKPAPGTEGGAPLQGASSNDPVPAKPAAEEPTKAQ